MQNNLQAKIDNYKTKRERKKKSRRILLTLSLVAALCTMYLLILPAITQNGQAYCGFEEHTHGAECYVTEIVTEDVLICPLDESEEHTHGLECYETSELEVTTSELKCELEEHTHILECFSNPEADLESPEIWKATFDSVELSGNWAEDLVAVAKTQIGYEESKKNYIVLEDGETMLGYTRYGQWYGMPYGEWSGMFTAFCLNYAGVGGVDYDQDLSSWVEKAKTAQLYIDKAQHTPKAGDLVYFDVDKNGQADAIGIVSEYMEADGTEPAAIKVIQGDVDNKVCEDVFEITNDEDDTILGFLKLPENPNPGSVNEGEDGEGLEAGVYENPNIPANGDKYHATDYLYYQPSTYQLGGAVVTFMLTPSELYGDGSNYTPNPNVPFSASNPAWTADNKNANYVVAYCCDKQTYSSSNGENYTTYTLDNSRFTDETVRLTLDGIVKHSYPFISSAEMKAQLEQACDNNEIKYNGTPINVKCCQESEFIAAAQWAIWDTTNVAGSIDSANGTEEITNWEGTLYHMDATLVNHENDYITGCKHVKAIRDWLITQMSPEDLKIINYTTNVENNSDGLYDLEVTVNLNRAVVKGENVKVAIVAGDKKSNVRELSIGEEEFTLNIEELTADQILNSEVDIKIENLGVQTYYYDSENFQDLIGGAWGLKEVDLSFALADEETNLSVRKVWNTTENIDKTVYVQLYADGTPYGDKVALNKNNWTYTWENLPKYNPMLKDAVYTVREDPVPGYDSVVTVNNGSSKTQIWQQISEEEFKEGGQYLIRSKSGFLEQHTFNGAEKLTWSALELSNPASIPNSAIWTAVKSGANGGIKLKNNRDGYNYYLKNESVTIRNNWGQVTDRYDAFILQNSSSSASTLYYKNGHIYSGSGNSKKFASYLHTSGDLTVTSNENLAAHLDIFKLTEIDMPNSDKSFVLTNTQVKELTSVEVTKEWIGRNDGKYPQSVEVSLLRNGELYGNPIELNDDNNWTYRWVDLPAKVGTEDYSYTIQETQVGGYNTSINYLGQEDDLHKYKITNTWSPDVAELMISKVDLNDPSILLPGAKFELYGEALQNAPITTFGLDDTLGTYKQEITVGDNGTVTIQNLVVGETYYLVETEAPEGYNMLDEPIQFVVEKVGDEYVVHLESSHEWVSVTSTNDGLAISVKNERGYSLPETGGPGTEMFKIVGAILVIVTALLYLKRRSIKL